jgi:DNA polymerase-4
MLGPAPDPVRLRILFLDLNSYFASVEQAERPELLGQPVVVAPVMSDSTFAIAASYPAKAYGIRTGTRIGEARAMCPGLHVVPARPRVYASYHERIVAAVSTVLPVEQVHSIDEMSFRLLGEEREPARAAGLAASLKQAISDQVSPALTCSIGIASNRFLAKVATGIVKPDGLTVLMPGQTFETLAALPLLAFPGINRRMEARLRAGGIFCTRDMLSADEPTLRRAFGSRDGSRWWWLLRGHEAEAQAKTGQSLSHSHVLPPRLRTVEGCRAVLLRLAAKAALRLRREGLRAGHLSVGVAGTPSWAAESRLDRVCDTPTVCSVVEALWEGRSFDRPTKASIVFTGLTPESDATPSLFDDRSRLEALSRAMDGLNAKFGKDSVFVASLGEAKDAAEERIAFQKTTLLDEGAERAPPPGRGRFRA